MKSVTSLLVPQNVILKSSTLCTYVQESYSNSIGVQMLKKMGWREGHGIGSKMSRRALEKQKCMQIFLVLV